MDENEQKVSKYSSGINIILRLDLLWKESHLYAKSGQYSQWNNVLDCIWRELARDLNDDNYQNKLDKLEDIENKIKDTMPFHDSEPEGFRKPTTKEIENRNKQYQYLNEKQLFLARLENFLGKGTTEAEDDDDDFD